jgi:hypothetical protein
VRCVLAGGLCPLLCRWHSVCVGVSMCMPSGNKFQQFTARTCSPAVSAWDTIGNAWFTRIMHTDITGVRNLLVVTSDFHLPRSQVTVTNQEFMPVHSTAALVHIQQNLYFLDLINPNDIHGMHHIIRPMDTIH